MHYQVVKYEFAKQMSLLQTKPFPLSQSLSARNITIVISIVQDAIAGAAYGTILPYWDKSMNGTEKNKCNAFIKSYDDETQCMSWWDEVDQRRMDRRYDDCQQYMKNIPLSDSLEASFNLGLLTFGTSFLMQYKFMFGPDHISLNGMSKEIGLIGAIMATEYALNINTVTAGVLVSVLAGIGQRQLFGL